MIIADLLKLFNIPRDTYNSLRQRGRLNFMQRPELIDQHVAELAMGAFELLRYQGMDALLASEAVSHGMSAIVHIADAIEVPPVERRVIGMRTLLTDQGLAPDWLPAWGSREGPEIGRNAIDLSLVQQYVARLRDAMSRAEN